MKISFMTPLEKPHGNRRINPFNHDLVSMGQPIGTGRLTVMFQSHDDYDSVYLVDTITGARVRVELDKPKTKKTNLRGG